MKTNTAIAPIIAALLCVAFASCKKGTGGSSGDSPPQPAADTHENIAQAAIDLNSEFVESLANASDKASAEAAAAKVGEIATRFEAIATRMEAIGPPQGDLKAEIAGMFQAQQATLNEKVNALMGTLLGDKEVGTILNEALQQFEERTSKLSAIDLWSGGGAGE